MPTSSPATHLDPARPAPGAVNTREDDPAAFFAENGFYVLHDGLSGDEVAGINENAVALCRGELGSFPGLLEHAGEGGGDSDLSDEQVIAQYLCIHFPHVTSELMRGVLSHRAIVDVLTRVIGPDVKAMQSMLFIKAAGKPGQAWHQDEDFIPTRDRSLCGAWIALDDATVDNGCLWVIPGSHRHGVLWPMEAQDTPRLFGCSSESRGFPYTDEDAVPVEVKAGSVVFFNGYTLHRSLPNRKAEGFRRALVNHYMSAQSLLPWFGPRNLPEPVGTADDRDVVLVAGKDPYPWKGYTTGRRKPHIRPDGEGGCDKGDKAETKREAKPR